ncbi:MAG: hypothetical protein PVI87_07960 [Gammaproteobacteria bacterium]|jgi:hypothetical protein
MNRDAGSLRSRFRENDRRITDTLEANMSHEGTHSGMSRIYALDFAE